MLKKSQKIAILGANSHISKNLIFYFSQNKNTELILFSRNKTKLNKILNKMTLNKNCQIYEYGEFSRHSYDGIINCVGIGDPKKISSNTNILEITEFYDNMILEYLTKKRSPIYINFSSGAVYGHDFPTPTIDSTLSKLDVNHPDYGYFYSVAKLHSEAKHRFLKNLNIVDFRLFGFFSRFIDLDTNFLMSELVNAIKNNKTFTTDRNNIIRDYIYPKDLFSLIKLCIGRKINNSFDICSKKPIAKFELLDFLSDKYGLNYSIQKKIIESPTGIKVKYYSKSKKISTLGFAPKYSSLESIDIELESLFNTIMHQ